ncbi:hypothetical protein Scep_014419 [Stephania cephalantha]|uniref:Uncharacterized protein n=1 Tax=Stephania cephalantha TaxID=152367 RepID=A0AAP0P0C8_9MAGN
MNRCITQTLSLLKLSLFSFLKPSPRTLSLSSSSNSLSLPSNSLFFASQTLKS